MSKSENIILACTFYWFVLYFELDCFTWEIDKIFYNGTTLRWIENSCIFTTKDNSASQLLKVTSGKYVSIEWILSWEILYNICTVIQGHQESLDTLIKIVS